ncbi:hypothetical protein ACWF94_39570 [Streptomyces sp. NPDC055078]
MAHVSEDDAALKKSMAQAAPGQIWHHSVRESVDAAIGFLNIDPVQGAGEAIITNRSDGQVDLVYLL